MNLCIPGSFSNFQRCSQHRPIVATITHIPSLSLPSCFRIPFFRITERSRSIARWLTYKVSDISLPVIVRDSLMNLRIFCWRSVSFVSVISPSLSPTFGLSEEQKWWSELGWSRFGHRLQFVFITIQSFGLITDTCESATSLLHVFKLSHNVCLYGIAHFGRYRSVPYSLSSKNPHLRDSDFVSETQIRPSFELLKKFILEKFGGKGIFL